MSFEPCVDIRLKGLHLVNKTPEKEISSDTKENAPPRRYSLRGRGRRGRGCGFIGSRQVTPSAGKEIFVLFTTILI